MRVIVAIFAQMRIVFALLSVSVIILTGCLEDSACGSSRSDRLVVTFQSKVDGKSLLLPIDSIHVKSPSLNLIKDISTAEFEIPLVPAQSEIYVVFTGENIKDSIRVSYESAPKLYAPNCDVELVYSSFNIVESSFDSLSLNLQNIPPGFAVFY